MEIEEYRARLEEFTGFLNGEYFLHYSGQKESLETAGFYSEYSDLFSLDTIREIQNKIENVSPSFGSRRKSLNKLLGFAVEQHLEQSCNPLTEQIAEFESKSTVIWDGRKLSFNQIANELANEPHAFRRRSLNEMRAGVLDKSNCLREERLSTLLAAARTLGFKRYINACEFITGIDYRALMPSLNQLLEVTEAGYIEALDVSFMRALGIPLSEAHRCDVGYWTRGREYDRFFQRDRMLPALFETLQGLGIELARQENVFIDLEERPSKHPRAFCALVRVPQEIKIVLRPRGGQDDYMALLHESGHAQHFAWTSAALPAEHRLWGDRGLSEVYAFLFEHLIWNRRWLETNTGFTDPGQFLLLQGLARVHLIRRYCGKLQFEIGLHGDKAPENPSRAYAEMLERSTGLRYDHESYLEDLDDGFYSADYLRAWAFEAQLRDFLLSKFGSAWFQVKAAGDFMKEIWETGQLYTVEELCGEIGIGRLDFQPLNDELKTALKT